MLTSIGKFSKSFFIKLLVGIIILPFVFWGMGDVFRGGNQNVIASIDSEKISTQEFVEYLRRLNLNEDQIENLPKTDLIEKISELIDESFASASSDFILSSFTLFELGISNDLQISLEFFSPIP